MKKIIWRIFIIVLVVLVLAIVAGMVFLDPIVKKGIETVGPNLTKVSVTVDSVHVSLIGASGKIKRLVIGNPEGYKTTNAISVGAVGLSLKLSSVLSDKVVIKSIELKEPEINLEGTLRGDNNLSKILGNVEGTSNSTNEPASQTTPGKPAKKLEVDDFLITDAKVHVSITGVGGITLPIPEIHLTNLGKGPDGITAAELTKVVLRRIVSEVTQVAADYIAKVGKDVIQKEAGKVVNDAAGKIGEGLGNLLKKK